MPRPRTIDALSAETSHRISRRGCPHLHIIVTLFPNLKTTPHFSSFSPNQPLSMSAPPPHPISPPPGHGVPETQSTSVRRHHTITAASRSARTATRAPISEESQEQQSLNDEEVVDQEWVRSVGAVGEKSSLHRQNSLPARYNRGMSFHSSQPRVSLEAYH